MKNTIRWMLGAAVLVTAQTAMAQNNTSHQPAASTATAAVGGNFNPTVTPLTPPSPPSPPVPPSPQVQSVLTPVGQASLTSSTTQAGVSLGTSSGLTSAVSQLAPGGVMTTASVNQVIVRVNLTIDAASHGDLVALANQIRSDVASALGLVNAARVQVTSVVSGAGN